MHQAEDKQTAHKGLSLLLQYAVPLVPCLATVLEGIWGCMVTSKVENGLDRALP